VSILLTRHAKAGSRSVFGGDDHERPLIDKGRAQADGLVAVLSEFRIQRVLSSSYLRCIQTVTPLAAALGLVVEVDERLVEGSPFEPVLELLDRLPDDSLLCSHGDVIPALVDALERRGMEVFGFRDSRKGATWVLERDSTGFRSAKALPPPGRDDGRDD
jgi:8-oxo-dGTP diphosphatase